MNQINKIRMHSYIKNNITNCIQFWNYLPIPKDRLNLNEDLWWSNITNCIQQGIPKFKPKSCSCDNRKVNQVSQPPGCLMQIISVQL